MLLWASALLSGGALARREMQFFETSCFRWMAILVVFSSGRVSHVSGPRASDAVPFWLFLFGCSAVCLPFLLRLRRLGSVLFFAFRLCFFAFRLCFFAFRLCFFALRLCFFAFRLCFFALRLCFCLAAVLFYALRLCYSSLGERWVVVSFDTPPLVVRFVGSVPPSFFLHV